MGALGRLFCYYLIMKPDLLPWEEEHEAIQRQKCMEKLTWKSEEEANAAIAYAVWQYGGGKLKSYRCRYCDKWHIARD